MKKSILVSLLVLAAILFSACGSGLPNEMLNTTWEWQQLTETAPASQSVVADSQNYTIVFTKDDLYNVKADCNMLSGEYQVSGSSLTLMPGPSTLAMCPPESSHDLYIGFLAQVDGYELKDGKLILTFGDGGGQMIFANVGPAD